MGHYYSEMRGFEPHELLENFLNENKGDVFTLKAVSGKEINFKRHDIRQILRERKIARDDLAEVRNLFHKLSR